MLEYSSTVNELKSMADENGVAPEQADTVEDDGSISIGDVAKAAGLESFFENASEDESEEESQEEESPDLEETEVEETAEQSEEEPAPEDSDGVKKRIGKLIEARNKAIEEAEEAKAQLQKLEKSNDEQPRQPNEKGMDRFDEITTINELKDREEEAEHLREWLLENPDGGEYTDISGEAHDVDYDQARQLTVATDRDLRKNIPKVAQRIQQREANVQQAIQTFDWMKDPASPESIEVQNILKSNSVINDYYKKDPFAVLTVGYAIEGIKAINAKNQNTQQAQARAPKVPAAPTRAAPKVVKGKGKDKKALFKKAMSGEVEDAASYIATLL